MEGPKAVAGADVEPAYVAFIILVTLRRRALAECRADDRDVASDDGGALVADLARDEIGKDRLVNVRLQVDDAVRAERRNRRAGFRVERDQAIARRDIEDPLLSAVGPV